MTIAGESNRRPPLARTLDGSPFVVAVEACAWRIRRWRVPGARGAPELVYGEDALPLEIPIDTPVDQFRELVGNRPGRYRLDAVDGDGIDVPKAGPAYLQIEHVEAARNGAVTNAATVDPTLEVMREMARSTAEMARINSELARTVIERLPSIIDAASGLLRAADGAGLPQRAPLDPRNAAAVEVDDDDDDDSGEARDGWAETARHVADQVLPMVKLWMAQRATRNAATDEGARTGCAAPKTSAVRSASAPKADRDDARHRESASPTASASGSRFDPTPDQLAHFAAVQLELTPREGQIARALAVELGPDEMAAWLGELCRLSVPDAVALIRHHLSDTAPQAAGGEGPTGAANGSELARAA